jgi:Tfp pilus assembly protein FimT
MTIFIVLAAVLVSIAVPLIDRLTDAPVMRRHVNEGTRLWRLRERARQEEGSPLLSDDDMEELSESEPIRAPRTRPRVPFRG